MPFSDAASLFSAEYNYKIPTILSAPELVRNAKEVTISKITEIGTIDCLLIYASIYFALQFVRTATRISTDFFRIYNAKRQYGHEY
jgi:hypothetical protein